MLVAPEVHQVTIVNPRSVIIDCRSWGVDIVINAQGHRLAFRNARWYRSAIWAAVEAETIFLSANRQLRARIM